MKKTIVELPEDLHAEIKRVKREYGITMQWIIEQSVKKELNKYPPKK